MSGDLDLRTASEESLGLLARYGNSAQLCADAQAELDRRARKPVDDLLLDIARKHVRRDLATLEMRNSDSLDFLDVSVWGLRDALHAAYQAGLTGADNDRMLLAGYRREYTALVEAVKAALDGRLEAHRRRLSALVHDNPEGR